MDFRKLEGEEVMWLKNIKVDFIVGELRIQLDNLFNGNKILGKIFYVSLRFVSVAVMLIFTEEFSLLLKVILDVID